MRLDAIIFWAKFRTFSSDWYVLKPFQLYHFGDDECIYLEKGFIENIDPFQ